jgi:eukaryotic-like serine/threonine-protein kinase
VQSAQSRASQESESQFGKYRLIASLGHGGMADVFLAVVRGPAGFNKLQVIKRLRPNLAEEPEFIDMFLDEARLAARLSHPNVVQTHEVGELGGSYFMAMEFLDGQPLSRVTRRAQKEGGIPTHIWLQIVIDALAGLHYAHELKDYDGTPLQIVHRDASPHNIFVTYDGQAKVVDFGIAKAASRSSETRTGVLKGKVAYMAPEQARSGDIDRRADIFVCGVLMWELIAGTKMWKSKSDIETLEALVKGRYPNLRAAKADVPDELERICLKALALNPDERYATATDMRADLISYLEKNGHRRSAEEVGKYISDLFKDKRDEFKALIETQLSNLKDGDGGLALVDINSAATSTSLPRISTAIRSTTDARGSMPSQVTMSQMTPSHAGTGTLQQAGSLQMVPQAPPQKGKGGLLLGAVAVALAGGALALALGRQTPPPAPPPAPAASTQAQLPVAAPGEETVEF